MQHSALYNINRYNRMKNNQGDESKADFNFSTALPSNCFVCNVCNHMVIIFTWHLRTHNVGISELQQQEKVRTSTQDLLTKKFSVQIATQVV